MGTSPVFYKDVVILQCDEDDGKASFIVALDKATGKEVWRASRKVQLSWATPVLVRAGGRDELVTAGNEHVIAYDPATGSELWRVKGLESNAVPSPVVVGDIVVVSAGYPSKLAMARARGRLGRRHRLARALALHQGHGLRALAGGRRRPRLPDDGQGPLDLPRRRHGRGEVRGRPAARVASSYMASPVVVGGRILLMSMDGDTHVIKAGPTHEVLRTNALGEPIAASAAVAPGRLYIRGERHLFAIGSGT